ncbi:MAG: hypothetical protein DRQ47_09815 [Gammaproteobacteria bacterium]|nr:MAG: hypothetical protein DRQ47_09815 [Gammaproteobacteria bacterium]
MSIDVIQAYDGLSSVEICKEERFDLILMDIRMPGLDGIEASQRIRKEGINQRTPIIALTAHAMAGEKEQLLANGLEDYMTKPVSTQQLKKMISKWTGQIAEDIKDEKNSPDNHIENGVTETGSGSIDWDACLHISGGREKLAGEMLGDLISAIPAFSKQLKSYEQTLEQTHEINTSTDPLVDSQQLLADVHKLHGLVCYTGVPILQSLAAKLEKQLKTEPMNSEAEQLLSDLINELSNVEKAGAPYLPS